MVCPEVYRRFVISKKFASYCEVEKLAKSNNADEDRKNKTVVARVLLEILTSGMTIVYFDSTTVCDMSFRKKAWSLSKHSNKFPTGKQLKTIKVYACLSVNGIESLHFWMTQIQAKLQPF